MDANQNPPSEREWTLEEQEEFFASQDAVTGLLGGGAATNWTSGEVMPPITLKSLQEAYQTLEETLYRGIRVISITPPKQGWPVAFYCPLCKVTTFLLSPLAVKPEDGDYWRMEICGDEVLAFKHNMQMSLRKSPVPPLEESTDGNYLLRWPE